MEMIKMFKKMMYTALAALLVTLCGLNTSMAGHAFGGGCGGKGNCGDNLVPLSGEEIDGLKYIREEEKLARDIYWMMADEHGLIIFTNIARSEEKHMAAVKSLLDKYGEDDPAQGKGVGEFTDDALTDLYDLLLPRGLESLMEGLQVGGEVEEIDIADIQAEIDKAKNADVIHTDIISTYENLMCGARNHLRAFVKQLEIRGGSYDPLEMTPEELSVIVEPPITRKCGSTKKRKMTE